MFNRVTRAKRQAVELCFRCEKEFETSVLVPLNVDPHTLVVAAWDRFLPAGVLPARFERDGAQLAFYNPLDHLGAHGVTDGDVLICESDHGQALPAPSMLQAYRVMFQYAAASLSRAGEFGHVA